MKRAETDVHDGADSFLVTHLVPSGVLVNNEMEILRFHGDVSPYLTLIAGEATLNLFRLIRHREVLTELRPAVRAPFATLPPSRAKKFSSPTARRGA